MFCYSNVATSYFLPEQQNEVGDVDMRIRETSSENSQEISEAYLGDTIFMFLKYVGSELFWKFSTLLKNCISILSLSCYFKRLKGELYFCHLTLFKKNCQFDIF